MRTYLRLIFVLFLSIASLTLKSQTKTEKVVDQATTTINSVKQLFGKKKAKKDSSTAVSNTLVTNKLSSDKLTTAKFNSKGQYIPLSVTIAPNAKVIDCDEMYAFNLGAAIIKKGTSYALIDTAGNFIIPYNQYSLIEDRRSDLFHSNGIFFVKGLEPNPKQYYINNKGKILSPVYSSDYKTNVGVRGKYIIITTGSIPNVTNIIIDKDGARHTIHTSSAIFDASDNIFMFNTSGKDGFSRIALIDIQGNTLGKPLFTQIGRFENGIALVDIKDEFGRIKGGAINGNGKFTLPPLYNLNTTSTSHYGDIVGVPGSANDDYDNEYYNVQNGKMIFKETKETEKHYGEFSTIRGKYPATSLQKDVLTYIMDSSGNILNNIDLLTKSGIKFGLSERYYRSLFDYGYVTSNDVLVFDLDLNNQTPGMSYSDKCFYYMKTGKHIILPGGVSQPFVFDPVAHLTYLSIPTEKRDNRNNQIKIEGYMNRDGFFTIVKGNGQ